MPLSSAHCLLLGGAALAVLSACSAPPAAQDALATQFVEALAAQEVPLAREPATDGPPAIAFPDRSMAATEARRVARLQLLSEADRIDAARLPEPLNSQFRSARILLSDAVRLDRHGIGWVDLGDAGPYLLTPDRGAYVEFARDMIWAQPIRDRASADLWLQRLARLGDAIRQDIVRFDADVAAGAIPPAELLSASLARVQELNPDTPDAQPLLVHFGAALAAVPDIPPEVRVRMLDEARAVLSEDLSPALYALSISLRKALPAAPDVGLWRLPKGETYYADLLRVTCGTDLSPAEVQALAVSLAEQQTERLNDLLTGLGLTEGSVVQRLQLLAAAPDQQIPPANETSDPLPDLLTARIADLQGRVSRVTGLPVPPAPSLAISPPQPLAPSGGGWIRWKSEDGAAALAVDPARVRALPVYALTTAFAREGGAGKQLMFAANAARVSRSLLDGRVRLPAFEEGWSSYAEDLAGEAGVYDSDLPGRAGYYQARLREAAAMAADAGLNTLKWTRADTLAYLQTTGGFPPLEAEAVVADLVQRPGAACAPMMGRETFRQLRLRAETALGSNFSAPAFNDLILSGGPRPLQIVESDIAAWIDAALRPAPTTPPAG